MATTQQADIIRALASASRCNSIWLDSSKCHFEVDGLKISCSTWACNKRNFAWASKWLLATIRMLRFEDNGYRFIPEDVWVSYYREGATEITVDGRIRGPHGRVIGHWSRIFSFTKSKRLPSSVEHVSFYITYKKYRGQGLAKAWFDHSIRQYHEHGFKRVEVVAGGDNGRYTWATFGFELIPNQHGHGAAIISYYKRKQAHDIIQTARDKGEIDDKTAATAEKFVERGLPRGLKISQVAALGKRGNGTVHINPKRPHLGKELLLLADTWDGRLDIKKWLAEQ